MIGRIVALGFLAFCIVFSLVLAAVMLLRPMEGRAANPLSVVRGDAIAIVRVDGVIDDSMVAPSRLGRDSVSRQLQTAAENPSVKAIVLRINSPGGSASASEALYQQILRTRDDKPVVAHFADIAASGGYYIAAAANEIVSQPTAITGSIGVILVSPDLRGLYEKIGYDERVFKSGPYKDILSSSRDVTPAEERILQSLIDDTLTQFIQAIVTGRGMNEADVRRIADGRVVSGAEARRLGLVDAVGDEQAAINRARDLAGLTGQPRIIIYEQQPSLGLLGLASAVDRLAERIATMLRTPAASLRYEWRVS